MYSDYLWSINDSVWGRIIKICKWDVLREKKNSNWLFHRIFGASTKNLLVYLTIFWGLRGGNFRLACWPGLLCSAKIRKNDRKRFACLENFGDPRLAVPPSAENRVQSSPRWANHFFSCESSWKPKRTLTATECWPFGFVLVFNLAYDNGRNWL